MAADQAIYRISFWNSDSDARSDLASRGYERPHTLLRVRRMDVADHLNGWAFDEDDFLPGKASLIWHRGDVRSSHLAKFFDGGVPTSAIEVWDEEQESWKSWTMSVVAVPDAVRMARIGWQPTALITRQGGGVLAHWQLAQHPSHRGRLWCLLTLHERAAGTLGTEDAAVARFVNSLLTGSLRHIAPALKGVLTVHPGDDRLWTKQFVVSAVVPPAPPRWHNLLKRGDKDVPHRQIESRAALSHAEVKKIIEASGLRYARPEVVRRAWHTSVDKS